MPLILGKKIKDVYLGSTKIAKAYLGNILVYTTEGPVAPTTKLLYTITNTPTVSGIQYSTDGLNWTNWTDGSGVEIKGTSIDSSYDGFVVYNKTTDKYLAVRNTEDTLGGYNSSIISSITFSCDDSSEIELKGKLNSLINGTTVSAGCFAELFNGFTNIKSINSLVLPSDQPAAYAYYDTFMNCSGITALPSWSITASFVDDWAFTSCFENCTGLTSANNLTISSTKAQINSLYRMFKGCSSLVTPLKLNNFKTLSLGSMREMFYNCTSLTSAPTLSATSFGTSQYIYADMFYNCSSLKTPPSLPATTVSSYCYYEMFKNSGLTTPPTISATTLATNCCESMLENCKSLTVPPTLPGYSTMKTRCFASMMKGCSKIKIYNASASGRTKWWKPPTEVSSSYNAMLTGTGGTYTATPVAGTQYYYK